MATGRRHCKGMSSNELTVTTRGHIMKKILAALALAASTAVLVTGIAGPASASAGIGVQLLDGTPGTSGMQASIAQGSSHTWHVKILNAGTTTETVAGFASSALGVYGGGLAAQPTSTLQSWITATDAPATLAPAQSATIAVTVTVPASAPLGLVAGYAPGAPTLAGNAFWGYAYPAGGQVQIASASGFRMTITVTPAA
jgi:hypothetical protein